MAFNARQMSCQNRLNDISSTDNKDMKKTNDATQKPTDKALPPDHKGVPAFPEEIWKKALEKTRKKEKKDAGSPILWPMND